MPTRLLREGILTSDRVDRLDAQAEVFYRRLMSKVDDYGLYDARPSILRTSLYQLRVDRVREADITRWLAACEKAGLIALYESEGKPYLIMYDTDWKVRSAPKFPLPPENIRKRLRTSVPSFVVVDEVEGGGPRKRGKHALPDDFVLSTAILDWCKANNYDHPQSSLDYMRDWAKSNDERKADWEATLRNCIKADWGEARKKARERGRAAGAPKAVAPDCCVPGCKREGLPGLGGKCEVHYNQSRPLTAAQMAAGIA